MSNAVMSVFFDFRKAFDCIPHRKKIETPSPNWIFISIFACGCTAILVTDSNVF